MCSCNTRPVVNFPAAEHRGLWQMPNYTAWWHRNVVWTICPDPVHNGDMSCAIWRPAALTVDCKSDASESYVKSTCLPICRNDHHPRGWPAASTVAPNRWCHLHHVRARHFQILSNWTNYHSLRLNHVPSFLEIIEAGYYFTGRMLFVTPNQQLKNTKGQWPCIVFTDLSAHCYNTKMSVLMQQSIYALITEVNCSSV